MPILKDRDSGLSDPNEALREVEALLKGNYSSKQKSPETNTSELVSEELVETYQAQFLMTYFKQVPTLEQKKLVDIREYARYFRDYYTACVNEPSKHLSQALEINSKEAENVSRYLTLEGLANYANKRFERAVRNITNSVPGSIEEIQYRRNADYWSYVEEVTREASEMKG